MSDVTVSMTTPVQDNVATAFRMKRNPSDMLKDMPPVIPSSSTKMENMIKSNEESDFESDHFMFDSDDPQLRNAPSTNQTKTDDLPAEESPLQNRTDRFKLFVDRVVISAKEMFENNEDFLQKLPAKAIDVFSLIENAVEGVISLDGVSEHDAVRILRQLADIPDPILRRVLDADMGNLTSQEWRQLPSDLFAVLSDSVIEAAGGWGEDRIVPLCAKLFEVTSCPRNLQRALKHGVNCQNVLDLTDVDLRLINYPYSWTKSDVMSAFRHLAPALAADDIANISVSTLTESLKNISTSPLPFLAQRRELLKRVTSQYRTPTAWPETFLMDLGPLIEDLPAQDINLIRKDSLLNVVPGLHLTDMPEGPARVAIASGIVDAVKKKPSEIARALPWIKSDVEMMSVIDMKMLVKALQEKDDLTLTQAEEMLIAERLETFPLFNDSILSNDTDMHAIARRFICSFREDFFISIPNVTRSAIAVMSGSPLQCRKRARFLMEDLKSELNISMLLPFPVQLIHALSPADVRQMTRQDIRDIAQNVRGVGGLPAFMAYTHRYLIDKPALFAPEDPCEDVFYALGMFAKYIGNNVLRTTKAIPVSFYNQNCSHLNVDLLALTKQQAIVIVANIREQFASNHDQSLWTSATIARLGGLVRGLSPADIELLSLDSDLLTSLEILATHEDQLDGGQIESIVEKIRQYFDIANRNQIEDADDVTVVQIGRYMQFLNPHFEISKFPKQLRPRISIEIGRSRLLNIPMRKRQELLTFALKNMKDPVSGNLVDISSKVDSASFLELGHLRCGITQKLVGKLTKEALDMNMEFLQTCPLNPNIADTLAKRAIDMNMARLVVKEELVAMGTLIASLEKQDKDRIIPASLAYVGGYVAKSIQEKEQLLDSITARGFIRDVDGHEMDNIQKKNRAAIKHIYASMTASTGIATCHELVRLGPLGVHVADLLTGTQLDRCLDHLGTLQWTSEQAADIVNKIRTRKNAPVNTIAIEYPGLLPGVNPDEMLTLNMSDTDIIYAVGSVRGLSKNHLKNAFKTWLSARSAGAMMDDDVALLGNLLCGTDPEDVIGPAGTGLVSGAVIMMNLNTFGKLTDCMGELLKAYTRSFMEHVKTTNNRLQHGMVAEMGVLLGGLDKEDLQNLTKSQIKEIEPHVLTGMDPLQSMEFTAYQLSEMTSPQREAFTAMQRSYMSEEQLRSLQVDIYNTGYRITLSISIVIVTRVLCVV
ncbi:hypothetical protein DPMN_025720 [Dreissena polymorpha]|uniref:Uncharacterized protein n=1 Tax=Dreissena polymorpha TaxID=45954 RepID=A0A9D4LPS4_DREPO|nr:hypothetical protein DPMN_025720 [Dreissena polymorpha]